MNPGTPAFAPGSFFNNSSNELLWHQPELKRLARVQSFSISRNVGGEEVPEETENFGNCPLTVFV